MAFNITRRKFLQSASLAAVALPLSGAIASESGVTRSPFEAKGTLKDDTVAGGVCEMCFWRCQLVGKKRGDRLVKLEGNPKSIDNGTTICARGNAGIQLLYDPDRLKYPLKNVGERGNLSGKKSAGKKPSMNAAANSKQSRINMVPRAFVCFPMDQPQNTLCILWNELSGRTM